MSRAGRRSARLALAVAMALAGAAASAAPLDDAILPLEAYVTADLRALAEGHAGELQALHHEIVRCAAGVALHRHGIAFRRPRGQETASPHLTLWVWLDRAAPARGPDLVTRAADAFRRHGQPLVQRLVGRSAIFADPRVAGYGLILSWLGPSSRAGREVAESLAVFADKLTAANFAHETIGPAAFLARAEVRAFDGQTELGSLPLALDDAADRLARPDC